ncbi:aldose 1-epimerase family protein [Vagococcus fluvialis]|uniref:aldose 1-epimerase family protein n=1 Tax=Vagococcus fluvialis TaxID=2738 RepID=UPI001D0B6D6C|nr:aldose 1-epimerase family protein [Vagococcus fluvialis]UDM79687.1 aldose 1-epimerase family protein [Vagococcus fluvialis]
MKTFLENDLCQVTINHHGAELSSFLLKEDNLEYIWQGDPKYWGRHAPVLFPFVGKLRDNQYSYNGKTYEMGQHGFARDMVFELISKEDNQVTFSLKSNEETLKKYPFEFELKISYSLIEQDLTVAYEVTTTSNEMFFSIGGHPAFNTPLTQDTTFEDYYLHFAPSKSRFLLPLDGPYVNLKEKTLAQTNTSIQLNREFFANDAFILETKGENSFSILSDKTDHCVSLTYTDLPYVGIWTTYPTEAPFVCIEPWNGIADTLDATGKIEDKLGINRITPSDIFKSSYTIKIR